MRDNKQISILRLPASSIVSWLPRINMVCELLKETIMLYMF